MSIFCDALAPSEVTLIRELWSSKPPGSFATCASCQPLYSESIFGKMSLVTRACLQKGETARTGLRTAARALSNLLLDQESHDSLRCTTWSKSHFSMYSTRLVLSIAYLRVCRGDGVRHAVSTSSEPGQPTSG